MPLNNLLQPDSWEKGILRPEESGAKPGGSSIRIPWTIRLVRWLGPPALLLGDYVAVVSGLKFAFWLCNQIMKGCLLPGEFQRFVDLIIPGTYIWLMACSGLYRKYLPLRQRFEPMARISFFAALLTLVFLYFNHYGNVYPPLFAGLSFLTCCGMLLLTSYLIRNLMVGLGMGKRPALLVGSGHTAEQVAAALEENFDLGYKIVGIVEANRHLSLTRHFPNAGKLADIQDIVKTNGINDVIVVTPGMESEKLLKLVYQVQPHLNNDLVIIPDWLGPVFTNMQADTINGQETVALRIGNNLLSSWNRVWKRLFDLVAGLVLLGVALPLLVIIAVLIRRDSKGPVIFAHNRVGRNGKLFACYKFRTMVPDAEERLGEYLRKDSELRKEWEREFKLKNDPRVTRIGRFLRKTSLDELPQLLNILRGEMSLVGPRPIVTGEISKYKVYINDYYAVRPGLTGLWQVSGRNDLDYDARVQLDSWYVRNWTFGTDLLVLLKTVGVVLGRRGAY
jgi:Undecaprenyl-phosphate galactose phosphotransferase WbaP